MRVPSIPGGAMGHIWIADDAGIMFMKRISVNVSSN